MTQIAVRVALYCRVSTDEQHTLPMQIHALKKYAKNRQWKIVEQIQEIASGAHSRPKRDSLLKLARQRKIDAILVWRLDRWGRSVADLVGTLTELSELKIGFVSLSEALDLTTATGRAMAGLLAVFAEFERELLRERVKAGIAHARMLGKPHGRPKTVSYQADKIKGLFLKGLSKSEIARKLNIGRTSVRRLLS
jgi:putative DNA-invertase from lambdoid prophage Rac